MLPPRHVSPGLNVFGDAPKKFSIKGDKKREFWAKLGELERELSKQHGGKVSFIIVMADENIPSCNIKRGEIIAYNID